MASQLAARLRDEAAVAGGNDRSFKSFIREVKPYYNFYRHSDEMIEVLQAVADGELKRLMIFAPPRSGKAMRVDTPILTPAGFVRIDSLQPGDVVYDETGAPTTVVAVSPVWKDREMFRVYANDGAEVYVDAEHEWTTRLCRKHKNWSTHTTAYLAARTSDRRPRLPEQGCVQFPEADLPVDPWVLGLWLGDGSRYDARITIGDEDAEFILARLADRGYPAHPVPSSPGSYWVENLAHKLSAMGQLSASRACHEQIGKHVPEAYFLSSRHQRMELLRGLIDSDGHCCRTKGMTEFCNTDRSLAEAVQRLVLSLGVKARLWEGRARLYGKDCGPKYRVFFYMEGCASIPRKAEAARNGTTFGRYLSFEPAENGDTICIQVASSSHLFLAGEGLLPTHNSELVSRLFPAYYLWRYPERHFGLASYGSDLAYSLSRAARQNYTRIGGELSRQAQSVKEWDTQYGGGMWAAGVGGAITGKGFDCGGIDDCLKNAEDAQSAALKEKQWDWWGTTFYTRRQTEQAALIHTQTRWVNDDLAGLLLQNEKVLDTPQEWYIVNLEAIKSERAYSFPETCKVHEDWREPGEVLNPAVQSADELESIRQNLGSYWFSAMYQQNPVAAEGNMWKREWFENEDNLYDELPRNSGGQILVHSGGYDWDTAYTKDEKNAANAWFLTYRDANYTYVHDFDFRWCETPELVAWMRNLRGPHYIEKKASGKSAKQFLEREKIMAIEVPVIGGDKVARTRSVIPRVEAGRVKFRRAIIDRLLHDDRQGILAFPDGKYKDVNDALVQAIQRHAPGAATGKGAKWTF